MSMWIVSSVGENFNSWMHFQAILGLQQSWGKFVPFPWAYTTAHYQPHLFGKRSTWAAVPLRASIHCDCSKVHSLHWAFFPLSLPLWVWTCVRWQIAVVAHQTGCSPSNVSCLICSPLSKAPDSHCSLLMVSILFQKLLQLKLQAFQISIIWTVMLYSRGVYTPYRASYREWLKDILWSLGHSIFLPLPTEGHLGAFEFRKIKRKTALNICVQGFVWTYIFNSAAYFRLQVQQWYPLRALAPPPTPQAPVSGRVRKTHSLQRYGSFVDSLTRAVTGFHAFPKFPLPLCCW